MFGWVRAREKDDRLYLTTESDNEDGGPHGLGPLSPVKLWV